MVGGKLQSLAELEQLLNNAKLADGAELLKLLKHAKVADGAELLKLLDNIDSAARLLRMLDIATMPSGAKLPSYDLPQLREAAAVARDLLARRGWL
ncbi:MAG TPA: hypothetical protein VHT91_27415 [Kofleriaceae bacterium]|nr:hypothetical protein [Kofleriaceae bacterium]